jgi:hypothetical protein
MALLQGAGWRLVVVTNQSGIARGLFSSQDYERFTAHLRAQLQARWSAHLRFTAEPMGAACQTGRMFATLHTTAGDIRIELYPNHAPKTVANFVGLATGTQPWTDPSTVASFTRVRLLRLRWTRMHP